MIKLISNLQEFKILQKQYENLTLTEIETKWSVKGSTTMENITGFGIRNACILCRGINIFDFLPTDCTQCVWGNNMLAGSYILKDTPCTSSKWYREIHNAHTPQTLYYAVQKRAKYMKEIINEIEKDIR